ncbi:MAG: TonB-dependent receptor [Novosphingobium sp.]
MALIAGSALVTPAAAFAQSAAAADAGTPTDEIIVTGFRQSLEKALNLKRESVSAVDAIVAEDIAKFPDQNLAESLQRIPGISIQRDGGEGRSVNVRGLGPRFTRVRVNGMETIATSADGASASRERGFDFNVFASELFSSLVVHKTSEPSLDEGSLGAVIDLNTGNPLNGKTGITVVGSVQGSYNTLSKSWDPRLAGLLGWKSPDGTLGISISGAYSKSHTLELGNNTVRWAQAAFNSVGGTPCYYTSAASAVGVANIGGVYTPGKVAACDAVALAFHPRIPRYGSVAHDRERLGLTGSIQWEPTDRTKLSIDGLYSRFKETREEKWLEVLFRSNERATSVVNYTIDPATNNLVAGTFNNAYVRTEHYLRRQDTKFYQFSANLKQEFSDSIRVELLGGLSKSNANIPVETTIMFDDKEAQGFQYDYTNSRSPVIAFGSSVTDPANFQLAEIRDRPSNNTNRFRTLSLKAEWDFAEGFQVQLGGVYRRYTFDLTESARDTLVCPAKTAVAPDVVLGTLNCTIGSGASSVFGTSAVYGFPVTAALAESASLGNAGQPTGATSNFIVANLASAAAFTNLYGRTAIANNSQIRSVIETDKGAFIQLNAKGNALGMRYALNAGVRYMRTSQASTGIQASGALIGPVTVNRSYDDWLPSMNLAVFPADNFIVRFSASKVMTRPNLSQLTPGGSIDGFNYRISFGNPDLAPYRANAYDLSFEYYFAPQSIFSVALFKKDISSLPIGSSRTGTFASTGLPVSSILASAPAATAPEGQPWTITTFTNGTGGKIKGAEFSVSAPFRFLPGILANFGGIANLTLLDSSYKYTVVNASAFNAAGALAAPAGVEVINQLPDLAKKAFNLTLWYEDTKFSARTSFTHRSGFIDGGTPTSATGNVFEGYNAINSLDASMRYKITPQIELSIEATNLTDAYRDRYTDQAANRNYEYNHFGRTILFGARFKM